jgi:NNP family nitrate/nitrite transporter-like MFS transporter
MNQSPYRWVILVVTVLCSTAMNFSNLIFAARAVDVMTQFSMNQAQLASVATIGMLPGAFLSIILGAFLDKKGIKKITGIFFILATLCLTWRVFANSYLQLLLITILTGIFVLPINIVSPKLVGLWFSREEMGIAMGIYGAAAGVGTTLAFATGNLFSSGKAAFAACAVLFLILTVLWFALVKETPAAASAGPAAAGGAPPPPPKGSVAKVAKSANMWKVMFCAGLSVGNALLVNTYLTQALILERGLNPVNAGFVSTLLNVCLIIGGVLSGFVVSKTRRINIPYAFICIVGGIGYYLVWSVPFGPLTYILLAATGVIVSGSIGVNFTRIPLLPLTGDFGFESIATAAGMSNTALGIMAFLLPTIVAAIAKDNFGLVFIIAAVIFVIIGLLGMSIPELGESGKLAQAAKARGEQG